MNSSFGKLNWKDFGKGLLVAVGGSIVTALIPILNSGRLPTIAEFKLIGIAAIAFGGTYLLKNWVTNSNGQLGKKE